MQTKLVALVDQTEHCLGKIRTITRRRVWFPSWAKKKATIMRVTSNMSQGRLRSRQTRKTHLSPANEGLSHAAMPAATQCRTVPSARKSCTAPKIAARSVLPADRGEAEMALLFRARGLTLSSRTRRALAAPWSLSTVL